ncbi:MAG: citrate (Si)-synthase [Chloroflexi bacterium]|jgi:citrate synthase|nr:MAG: citrate (Si)-synthase [SAR202 cluster bacterium]MAX11946.1 citrate (Si)-synthase [Chloroflexota bacterium]|tara:strand:+ start:1919 stop:3058 length:1140 start_codon:yes stop_codon:yes gene_type:complete
MADSDISLNRGLQGIYLDRTNTTFIDGKEGVLEYSGYNIHDLAENSTFEETSYLLMYGSLPNKSQLLEFDKSLKSYRNLPQTTYDIIDIVKDSHPMDVLRTAISSLSSFDEDREDFSEEAIIRKGIRLTSQVPIIVMAHNRMRKGLDPIESSNELSHAANFLYMLEGEKPSEDTARLMDIDFVVHADHGCNASAFTTRVVTGTNADFYGAITAGIAALSGPSHGGAAEGVMELAKDVGTADNAANHVKNLLANRERVMGFGHRVYKAADPRAKHLKEGVKNLSEEKGETEWYDILLAVQEAMTPYARRGIHANVDFFAGAVYYLLGIPSDLFVPIFAVGRIPGWTIQILEQMRHNILIRPLLQYTGERSKEYIPIDKRD